jgi:hypothetical protein
MGWFLRKNVGRYCVVAKMKVKELTATVILEERKILLVYCM